MLSREAENKLAGRDKVQWSNTTTAQRNWHEERTRLQEELIRRDDKNMELRRELAEMEKANNKLQDIW